MAIGMDDVCLSMHNATFTYQDDASVLQLPRAICRYVNSVPMLSTVPLKVKSFSSHIRYKIPDTV